MICIASSKHRSMRFARMWNSKSPGVETAWRVSCANLPELMQFRRPRRSKEPVPRVGPKAHDAGEARFQVAKINCAQQRGEVPAERPHGRSIVEARVYCRHQENRGAGERRSYWLGNGPRVASGFGSSHRFGLHLDVKFRGFIHSGLISVSPPLVVQTELLCGPEWAARRHSSTNQAVLDCLCIRVIVRRVRHVLEIIQMHAMNFHVIDIDVPKHGLDVL